MVDLRHRAVDVTAGRDSTGGRIRIVGAGELTEREREILAFEREWWLHAGAKELAVRSRLAMSTADYYRILSSVIDRPEALAHDPLLVRRLRRMRLTRRRDRSARRTARRT